MPGRVTTVMISITMRNWFHYCACFLNQHVSIWQLFNESSSQHIPSWTWFTVGILLWIGHTLDGMDGKQARRTGRSSPLGELLDHGCDGLQVLLNLSACYNLFGQSDGEFGVSPIRLYGMLWCALASWHFSHWEKYNTGILYMPRTLGTLVKRK